MTYGYLLESIWHPPLWIEESQNEQLPSELELQSLWFAGAFGRSFKSLCGKSITISQFGEWNRSAGPDFLHAAVEIDGQLVTGPIELDGTAADWEQHGHATNPDFRDTILHVVFRASTRERFTRTLDHRQVPQVLISPVQLADALNRPPRQVAIAHPGRCLQPLRQLPPSALSSLLAEAAAHRARQKAKRFQAAASAHDRDTALFLATAETLGYRNNAMAMKILAQRCPLRQLRAQPEQAEALLFGSAGFLSPTLHETAPAETQEYLLSLWQTWWKLRGESMHPSTRDIPWHPHGQRPANHPHRRTGALLALVRLWPQYRDVAFAEPFAPRRVVEFLSQLRHDFWNRHHTLSSTAMPQPIALIGRGHALELLANHLIPLAMHERRFKQSDYLKLRHAALNDQVRRCVLRLFGSLERAKPWTRRLAHHQALLQVYHDFCLEDSTDCRECPFPEQLLQWR